MAARTHDFMETISKIEARIALAEERFIQPLLYPETRLLDVKIWEVGGEPVTYEDAIAAPFTECGNGELFDRAGMSVDGLTEGHDACLRIVRHLADVPVLEQGDQLRLIGHAVQLDRSSFAYTSTGLPRARATLISSTVNRTSFCPRSTTTASHRSIASREILLRGDELAGTFSNRHSWIGRLLD